MSWVWEWAQVSHKFVLVVVVTICLFVYVGAIGLWVVVLGVSISSFKLFAVLWLSLVCNVGDFAGLLGAYGFGCYCGFCGL